MAITFGFTKSRRPVPIAGWMLQGNPATFDVGTALAEASEEDDWRWTCHPTYRVSLVAESQPTFLWVTANNNPALTSGVWLAGAASGECYVDNGGRSELWRDTKLQKGRRPYLPMRMHTLVRPITRDELLAHPVLRELETLRMPHMSNPQIITPQQLDALHADFDLSSAPLTDAVRDAIRSEYPSELWVLGPGNTDIEADVDDGRWKVWSEGAEVGSYPDRASAYAAAGGIAEPNLPLSSQSTEWIVVAEQQVEEETAMIYRTGVREFVIGVQVEGDDDEYECEGRFKTLGEALAALAELVEDV